MLATSFCLFQPASSASQITDELYKTMEAVRKQKELVETENELLRQQLADENANTSCRQVSNAGAVDQLRTTVIGSCNTTVIGSCNTSFAESLSGTEPEPAAR